MWVGVDIILLHDFTFLPLALVFLLDEHVLPTQSTDCLIYQRAADRKKWNRFMESERNVDVGDTLC